MKVYIGCSGFYYKDWKGKFYPPDIPLKNWLEYYADQFKSVEINSSFYRIPAKKDLISWADRTPDQFRFVFKGYQYITHRKKLNVDRDLVQSLHDFYEGLFLVKYKLAGILWQFPSNFPFDLKRIEKFASHLTKEIPHFFEFRKPNFYSKEMIDFLESLGLGFCSVSAPGLEFDHIFKSNNWVYLRLHGKFKWYNYLYGLEELKSYQEQIQKANPNIAFVFFNNDIGANAPINARQMIETFNPRKII